MDTSDERHIDRGPRPWPVARGRGSRSAGGGISPSPPFASLTDLSEEGFFSPAATFREAFDLRRIDPTNPCRVVLATALVLYISRFPRARGSRNVDKPPQVVTRERYRMEFEGSSS